MATGDNLHLLSSEDSVPSPMVAETTVDCSSMSRATVTEGKTTVVVVAIRSLLYTMPYSRIFSCGFNFHNLSQK